MFRLTLKNLAARKLRLVLTALSVVLGVGFIAGTFVLTDTMNHAFDELFADTTSGVDVYVRSSDYSMGMAGTETPTVPESLVAEVRAVDGVKSAVGSVGGYAQFIAKDGKAVTTSGAPTLGASWSEGQSSGFTIRDGRMPRAAGEVLVDAKTAETQRYEVGDRVKVLFEGPVQEFEIVGTAGYGEADNLGGATLAVFDLATAQELFNKSGELDSIEVTSDGSQDDAALVDDIGEVLPQGYRATSSSDVAEEQSASIKDQLGFFTTSLLVFAAIAVLVGGFIIFNTFSIVVAQRTREFALLKSLGASGRQITASVLTEATLVGIMASVVGLGVGVAIAAGLKSLLDAFGIELPTTDLQFLPRTIVVSLIVGLFVTLFASLIPARKAARISPMAALRSSVPRTTRWSRKRTISGIALAGLGGALLLSGTLSSGNGASMVGAGALAVFFGVAVLTPLFAGPLARIVGSPLARAFGTPAKLAQENAAGNPKRTAATAAAIMIGLALVSLVSIMASSIKASTASILEDSVKADFVVMSGGIMMQGPGFSHAVAQDIASLEEVADGATLAYADFKTGGKTAQVAAFDATAFSRLTDFNLVSGSVQDTESGGVLVKQEVADQRSLTVGDDMAVEFARTGERSLPVIGLFEGSGVFSSDYVISNETFMENFRSHSVDIMLIRAAPGLPGSRVQSAIESVTAEYPNIEVKDQAAFNEDQASHINQLLGLVTALLGLALLIALFGITNTLALSVFERVKEIGLLRAVGMLRSQVRAAIRWEALIVSMIGALLGIVVGVFLGWSVITSLETEGISEFAVPGVDLALYLVAAGIAGIIAALPPARRAARLNVLEAIATE